MDPHKPSILNKKNGVIKPQVKPCNICRVVIEVNRPHLSKDRCIQELQKIVIDTQQVAGRLNERCKLIKADADGKEKVVWMFIKRRGGFVDVDKKELSAVPADAIVKAIDNGESYQFQANRTSQ